MNTYDEQVEKIMNNFDIQDFCWTDDSDNSRKLHTNRDVTEEVKSFIRSSLSSLRSTLEKPEEKDANDVNSLYLATKSEVGKVISEKWDWRDKVMEIAKIYHKIFKSKITLEKPIEGEWSDVFDKEFMNGMKIHVSEYYSEMALEKEMSEKLKSFIRQTILTERAKWKREMMEMIEKYLDSEVDRYGKGSKKMHSYLMCELRSAQNAIQEENVKSQLSKRQLEINAIVKHIKKTRKDLVKKLEEA